METIQLDLSKRYTFADYLTWIDDKRRELIDGFVKLMTPAPLSIHQIVSVNLTGILWNYFRKKKCKVFDAPFDVRLPKNGEKENDSIYTIVQPDICVICDPSKIDRRGCLGAPDFIIEIISEGNSKHDVETKFKLYEQHGVREYWMVYPEAKSVHTFVLNDNGKYENAGIYAEDSKAKVNIFEDFYIDLGEVFEHTEN